MTINPLNLESFIEDQGWSSYGVISVKDLRPLLEEHERIFKRWLSKGYQANMGYLEAMKNDRYHPENKLPDVKSIVVLQAWYAARVSSSTDIDQGIVARYARGRDYHNILRKKLKVLSEWLQEQNSEIQTHASVDSGPTVDRVLAEAAGLGFFGKNTNLIDPSKGSYFFIASLLVNCDLPVTVKKRMPGCGNCHNCLKACPSGALVAAHTLDARQCLSYLTIENKAGIPLEMRPLLGRRLFGCDICQEVCPFNEGRAGRQSVRIGGLSSENGVGETLDLEKVLGLASEEEFLEQYAGTPLMRAGRRGLLRNACIVAGNIGRKRLLSVLRRLIEREADPMLREHATWAIGRIEKRTRLPQSKRADE